MILDPCPRTDVNRLHANLASRGLGRRSQLDSRGGGRWRGLSSTPLPSRHWAATNPDRGCMRTGFMMIWDVGGASVPPPQ
jgi:hypothetical protein